MISKPVWHPMGLEQRTKRQKLKTTFCMSHEQHVSFLGEQRTALDLSPVSLLRCFHTPHSRIKQGEREFNFAGTNESIFQCTTQWDRVKQGAILRTYQNIVWHHEFFLISAAISLSLFRVSRELIDFVPNTWAPRKIDLASTLDKGQRRLRHKSESLLLG